MQRSGEESCDRQSVDYRRLPSSSESSLNHSNDLQSRVSSESPFSDIDETEMNESKYSKVIFNEISESYPTDFDIECRFYIGDAVQPSDTDKVGLFTVGWRHINECLLFKSLADCETNDDFGEKKVKFSASLLPKTSDELFQFCYVANDDICGASTPFRFIRPHEEDLIQLDNKNSDEEDFVVVRSQQALLQERLQQLVNENGVLEYTKRSLEQQMTSKNAEILELRKMSVDFEDKLKVLQIESNRILEKLKTTEEDNRMKDEKIESLEQMIKDMKKCNEEYETKYGSLQVELNKTLDVLKDYQLKDAKSEQIIQSRDQEIFDIIKKSAQQQVVIDELSSSKALFEAKLEMSSTSMAKVLSERRDLELENRILRNELDDIKAKCDSFQSKTDIMMSEILDFDKIKLKTKVQIKTMTEEMDELRQKISETESTKNSISEDWKNTSEKLEKEIDELKLRLANASEEYQKVYKYNTKLENRIEKMKSKVKKYFDTKAQTKAAVNVSINERQEILARAETDVKTVIESETVNERPLLGDTAIKQINQTTERFESIQLTQLPCIICNEDITCMTKDSKSMVQHLEDKHKQRLCPICSTPFDLTLPGHSNYFQMHVDNHFDTRQSHTAPNPPAMIP